MGEFTFPEPSPSPVRPAAPDRSSQGDPSSPSNHSHDEADLDLDLVDSTRSGQKRASTVLESDDDEEDHTVLVRSLAKHKDLDTNSELELEQFARLRPKQQVIAMQATQLAIKQALNAQSSAAVWAIPPELESSINKYTTAFVYSANCRAYKKWAAETILAAMRAGKVALPPDSDMGRIAKVLKRISDKLTDYRSELKRKIKDSIPASVDIATLAADIVNGSGVKLTVEFYHRLAWLRAYGPQAGFDKKAFWDEIDDFLHKARTQFVDARYSAHFKSVYRKDLATYGTEAINVGVVAISAIPEHQRLVEQTATNTTGTTRKRARVQSKTAAPRASSSASTSRTE
ncbi:hypothetical protein AURDEDRAFT_138092 [Auricularia subglabra TFB-10046 SS5]|nr:hypothetical protein AURDEDRAFT_138092 [Auricularia subglabra TFB-10046 SS5]